MPDDETCEKCNCNKCLYILNNNSNDSNGSNTMKICSDCFNNDYLSLYSSGWKHDDFELCEECNLLVNCTRNNIYIITRGNEEILWCKDCFDELCKAAYEDGWRGDDIESEFDFDDAFN